MSATAHDPKRRTCDSCKSVFISGQGCYQRCAKAGHAEAILDVNTFVRGPAPHMYCTQCQTERLASIAGGAQLDDYGPTQQDGANVKEICARCWPAFKDKSTRAARRSQRAEVVHDDTIVAVWGGDSSRINDSTSAQILRALEELRQGQRDIHTRQIEMRAVLDAHIWEVQRRHDASLRRRRAMYKKDAAEEVLRELDDMEMKDQ